jgi:phosphatidate cytidylyltransferase
MNWIETHIDPDMQMLFGGILALLAAASLIGWGLSKTIRGESGRAVIANLNARIRAWWIMAAVFAAAMVVGSIGTILLFGLLSFLALREFITLAPTRAGDHRALFWAFFFFTPLQYYLVAIHWYGLFSILIPVYAFLFLPFRSVVSGDTEGFLERTAKIQWGLMICVYCVSHAPAILALSIPGFEGQNARLLLFFILIVQISDVLQYVCGKTMGRHKIAPKVSPNKTWEGFIGGVLLATGIGTCLWWATPFSRREAAVLSLLICLMGFAGGLCMSAIKRDRGLKDFGAMIEGHGGILDRIDSICFAAPVFFHMVRYFFTP